MAEETKAIAHITRRGVVVWGLLILFIAAWMFVLGIMVGRGTAPMPLEADRLQQELSELKTALLQKEQAQMEAQASGETDQKTELGFYEALKETKRQPAYPVSRPSSGAAGKPAPGPAARLPLETANKTAAAESSGISGQPPAAKAAPVEQVKAVTAEKLVAKPPAAAEARPKISEKAALSAAPAPAAEAPKPAPAPAVAAGGGALAIQVGAFKDGPSAEQVVSRLRAKGFPAYQIRSESAEKGVWFRVRVGAFNDRAAAQNMLKKLDENQIKGIIVATP